jgi:UDPglucose 6-dehydrogenase
MEVAVEMRITVVGTGYVGLVAGTCFAETGNQVCCLDIDEAKIAKLRQGQATIYEPGLQELFHRNLKEGRLFCTSSYDEAVAHARIFFLCLPTPPGEDGSADTKYLQSAVHGICERLSKGMGPPPGENGNGNRA